MKKTNKKYDIEWFNAIKELADNGAMNKAISYLNDYMNRYPSDPVAKALYVKCLLSTRKIEETERFLNESEDFESKDFWKYCLAFSKGEYRYAYNIMNRIENYSKHNFRLERVFLEKKLGREIDTSVVFSYNAGQIINYSKESAIDHIKEKHYMLEDELFFEDRLTIEELYNKINEILKNGHYEFFSKFCADIYIFKISNKYLKVITTKDTKNIITMYVPDIIPEFSVINNLNAEIVENNKSKVKRLSQIEKFNMRYGA